MDNRPIDAPLFVIAQNTIIMTELAKIRAMLESGDADKILKDMHDRQFDFYERIAVYGLKVNLDKGGLE